MVNYTLHRSRRRQKSTAIQVLPTGEIVVSAPWYMPKFLIDRFVEEKQSWIIKQQAKAQKISLPRTRYTAPSELPTLIEGYLARYSALSGLTPASTRFKKVRTYWGSCSSRGVITFNTELCFVPPRAVEYVVVHELCHLRYRGHGVRFWDLVARYYPELKSARKLLRTIPREL